MQGDFGVSDGEAALHHILFEVLCQPWRGPLVKALEWSGFNQLQDVLFMNQGICLLSLMPMMLLLLCHMPRMLLNIKFFICYDEENGKPIMDWMKMFKAEYIWFRHSITFLRVTEKVTFPPCSNFNLPQHTDATMVRNVASSTIVTSASMISHSNKSQDDEDSGSRTNKLQHVLYAIFCEAIDSPLVKVLENHGFKRMSSC